MGAGKKVWGYYPAGNVWLPLRCNNLGQLEVDLTLVALGDLGDVNVAGVVNQDLIWWNAVAGEWQRVTPGALAGAIDLDDLADVNVAGVANLDLLWWNAVAGEWQDVAPGAMAGAIVFSDLADADTVGVVGDDILFWHVPALEWRIRSLANHLGTIMLARGDILRMGAAIAERYALGAQYLLLQAGPLDPHYDFLHWQGCERYHIPYMFGQRMQRFMNFDFISYDMIVTFTFGTGFVSQAFLWPRDRTLAVGDQALQRLNTNVLFWTTLTFFAQPIGLDSNVVDCEAFVGYHAVNNNMVGRVDITPHAGFILYVAGAVNTVYASCADGGAQTRVDLGLAPATRRWYAVIYEAPNVYFYADWALVATINTDVPGVQGFCWKSCIEAMGVGAQGLNMRNFLYGWDTL